ncbi:hypothetical protein K3G63_04705 [Hymenobacter sp. HSC-4F20]|uniref:hypothetical protein n=1 Tax=Hymenobacter sp. HSC-4F20 TaxID=2864135 RepID=UPI001C731617|nr:hypothetical protein [Hymenobacter sp. HSC-4F20]MBX0289724.1 hypothetical protein [Hymenobacter sp. HSC-4F20]
MTTKPANKASPAAKDVLAGILKAARDKYENDPFLETQKGVDIEVDGVGTFTILRAHGRNQKFITAYREKVVPYQDSPEAKAVKGDDPKLEALNRDVFAETIIIGLKDVAGNKVEYNAATKAAVKELLAVTPDLYTLLQAEALTGANFRKRYEAEEKN